MKRLYPIFVLLFVTILLSSSFVFAEESNSSEESSTTNSNTESDHKSKNKENKSHFENKQLNKQTDLRKKQDKLKQKDGTRSAEFNGTRSAEFKAKAAEQLKANFGKLDMHLLAYLTRLDKISEKINKRISKLKEKGVDTSSAEVKMVEAKALGVAAKAAIDKAKADIAAVGGTTVTKDSVAGTRQSIDLAKKALQSYHKSLMGVVRELARLNVLKNKSGDSHEGTRGGI